MAIDPNRVKEIFLDAVEQPNDAARVAFLDRACGGDAGLRGRVEVLLRSHDPAGSFLSSPVAVVPDPSHGGTVSFDPSDSDARRHNQADDESDELLFLTRSARPDSLGRIGHYEMLQVLGKGGFGIVFRAFDENLQRVVAVKVMAPQIATLSPARKRFLREAVSSAQVRHENVVQVYEVGEQPLPHLVMEFVPGETLQQKLDRTGPLDVPEVLRLGRQIAEGLAAAHACDLIHRDIKPSNILLEGGSHKAKITDFGLARAADDASVSQSGVVAGTPMFMSPEQALGQKIDQRADLFSLGSVLYQMVSGRPPFRAPSALAVLKRVAEEPPRPIPEIIPETPNWLCGIIAKLHAKNPEDRFQSAREVADVLANCEARLKAKQEVTNVVPAASQPAAPTAARRRKWVSTATVLLLAVIVLAATEFAGMTHLFRGQQAMHDPIKPGSEPQAEAASPAIAPFDGAQAQRHQEAWAKHLGVPVDISNSIGMKLRLIPPGRFLMRPNYDVTISKPFQIGTYEVTIAQFRAFVDDCGYKTSAEISGKGGVKNVDGTREWGADYTWRHQDVSRRDDYPVGQLSWEDAVKFCEWLCRKEGKRYRLPTEAEWEWAGRAGSLNAFHFGADPSKLGEYAWYADNSHNHSHPVGLKKPSPWGLYDVHGNISEFCLDWSADFPGGRVVDPRGPASGEHRVVRGFENFADFLKTPGFTGRGHYVPSGSMRHFGLRVVCEVDEPSRSSAPGTARLVAPFDARQAKAQQLTWAKKLGVPVELSNSIGMQLQLIPPGRFLMRPDYDVTISKPFRLGTYEVTIAQFRAFADDSGYKTSAEIFGNGQRLDADGKPKIGAEYTWRDKDVSRGDDYPAGQLSWDDAAKFCEWLSRKEGKRYRLPTEAEWEWACRAGSLDFYPSGKDPSNVGDYGWYLDNADNQSHPVGQKKPNPWGLFDMHGNVSEYCLNWFIRPFPGGSWTDPRGPADGKFRVTRGGGFQADASVMTFANRAGYGPQGSLIQFGFRVVCEGVELTPLPAPTSLAEVATRLAQHWSLNEIIGLGPEVDRLLAKGELSKSDAEQLYRLAVAFGRGADWQRAAHLLDLTLERHPQSYWQWCLRASVAACVGDKAKYEQCCTQIARIVESQTEDLNANIAATFVLASFELNKDRLAIAQGIAKHLEETWPNDFGALRARAHVLLAIGDTEGCRKLLEQVPLDVGNQFFKIRVAVLAATCAAKGGNTTKAKERLEQAAQLLDPLFSSGDLGVNDCWSVAESMAALRDAEIVICGKAVTPPLTLQRLTELAAIKRP